MHTTSYEDDQASVSTLSVLERYDAEECKSSEATWLPVTWCPPQSWQLPLGPKTRARAVSAPSKNKLPTPRVSAESALVTQVKGYVEEHYSEDLSLDTVAVAVGSTTSHLAKLFDEATGGDLDDYLVCVRVEKAKNLLLNPHYYFSEIATELGFESLGQFNQAFKRSVGQSPQAYRTRLPSRIDCVVEMD